VHRFSDSCVIPIALKTPLLTFHHLCNNPSYLSLCIVGPSQAEAQAWAGFVESRLRKLVSDLLGRSLPLKKIQLWPKKLEVCIAEKGALLTQTQRQNCITYFVGFQVDKLRMRGSELNLELPMQNFREWELARFQPLIPGMDILAKTFRVKELPKICFEGMYESGKLEAMKKRRESRENDPLRQEKRRLTRLKELKARMEEMQRKKQEEQDRKRKRDEVEVEDEEMAKVVKEEEAITMDETTSGEGVVENEEETNLLESILDTIQGTEEGKTREEAEADRQKLLAGELLDEGEDANENDEDEVDYTGDARQMEWKKPSTDGQHKDKRSLPVAPEDEEMLRKLGYAVVSDDESKILGTNLLPPWRARSSTESSTEPPVLPPRVTIRFREKFDIVELDANGHVIDKGDEDFSPSKNFMGRKAGFEFKLGDRGLGYYRTGKQVKVPSNTSY
jgi:hypothetical protein